MEKSWRKLSVLYRLHAMIDFPHIPDEEKKKKWFLLIEPLAKAHCSRPGGQDAKLLKAMQKEDGWGSWKTIRQVVTFALQHVSGAESIFSRASRIHTDPDPDGVIDDMFAEARAVSYILLKGFEEIGYNGKDGLDFFAKFGGRTYNIEVAYIRGPAFKTQRPIMISKATSEPVYELEAKKLINRLKTICSGKEKQATKHGGTPSDTIVFVISDLDEMYEPWLKHDKFQGQHPILGFVTSRKFPTVVFTPGTVYEPHANALDGVFGQLSCFEWSAFEKLIPGSVVEGSEDVPG